MFNFGKWSQKAFRFLNLPVRNYPLTGECHHDKNGTSGGDRRNVTREERIFAMIDKKGLGLEIGPSHAPLAPKREGYNVHIIDHLDADGLRQKYKGHHDVNLNNIEEVDFVWSGEAYPDLIGRTECYDWIIASHVIEHVPDFLSFLKQCETLLKPSGILSLAIPDRRYCFDHFNPVTTTGQILDAWERRSIRPTPGQVFDGIANHVSSNGAIAWGSGGGGPTEQKGERLAAAREAYERALREGAYIDCHCWRFTPASFRLIISDLQAMGLLELGIAREFDSYGCEFYASLTRGTTGLFSSRFEALQEIKNEGMIS